MFDEWKRAWRQAVENFQRELGEGAPAAPRLRAMERELASASGALSRLVADIGTSRAELQKEREAEQTCRRREALARAAGDAETAHIAGEYAARHGERADLLQRKIDVLEDERMLLARDVAAMKKVVDQVVAASRTAVGGTTVESVLGTDDTAFSRMERDAREREVDARLEELKKRMGS